MEVRPGIHRLQLPLVGGPPGGVNCYLIKGTDGWLLLDTGWNSPETFNALNRQIEESGASIREISQIVVTHIHPDHYGLAGRIRELSGASLTIHRLDSTVIYSRYVETQELLERIAQLLRENGVPENDIPPLQTASLGFLKMVVPAIPDELLSGGERIACGPFELEVLWTPGHSLGHICLYERSHKLLFSGDHVMPLTTSHVGLHAESGADPLGDYLGSLETLQGLEVDLVLPAHEDIFSNLSQRIDEILIHHRRRERAIEETLKAGAKTAYEVACEIPWMLDSGPEGTKWITLDALDRRLAVMETLAHLEAMRFKGKVDRFMGKRILYSLAVRGG